VSQKYGIFQFSEHKSTTRIGQCVFLWNYEHFLNIKYRILKLSTKKIVKEIKKVLPKGGIFQISEHKFPLSIGEHVSFWNFQQFLYIKCGLLKFRIVNKRKKKIKKVSPKYGIFKISEHKSLVSIGERVSLWNFEHLLYII